MWWSINTMGGAPGTGPGIVSNPQSCKAGFAILRLLEAGQQGWNMTFWCSTMP